MNRRTRHDLVCRIMQACLEVDPADRSAFLKREADGDTSIIREVEKLLNFDGSNEDGFSDDAIEEGHATLRRLIQEAEQPGADDDDEIPPTIANYHIIRPIGAGGMGIVYEAQQENPRRRVALKVIRARMASAQLVRRFQREAHVLGRLQHPGVAHIYESGFATIGGDRLPYFAMELIDGPPLDEFVRLHSLNVRQRMELVALAADAVHHAHQKGVVHRDLKPANILVLQPLSGPDASVAVSTPGSGSSPSRIASAEIGQPKVLDFGIARLADTDDATTTVHTQAGQIVGTLAYMSPEQVAGKPEDLDTRCDVYALGVIAYELISGARPYELTGCSIYEAARIVRDTEPSRVSSHDATLRGDVEAIVAKAMNKSPDRRYESAAALAADIRRYLRDEPVSARPITVLYQARKFARRHRGVVIGAGATLLSLVFGLVGMTWLALLEGEARRDSQAYAVQSERTAYLASLAAAAGAIREHDVASAERHLLRAPDSLRGWEWRHLHALLDQSRAVAEAPGRGIASQVIFGSQSQDVLLLRPHRDRFNSATLSQWRLPDLAPVNHGLLSARGAATLMHDGISAILLQHDGRATIERLGPAGMTVESAQISQPLDEALTSGLVKINDWPMTGDTDALLACANFALKHSAMTRGIIRFSNDGRWMATMNDHSPFDVAVWSVATHQLVTELPPHPEGVGDAVFSADGSRLVTAARDRTLRLWRLTPPASLEWEVANAHSDALLAVAMTEDGQTIATGGEDRMIRLWDADIGTAISTLHGHREVVFDVEFSADGRALVSCDRYTVRTWNADVSHDPRVLRGHTFQIHDAAISPDGGTLASVAQELILWDLASGERIVTIGQSPAGAAPTGACFVDNGRALAVAWCSADQSHQWVDLHNAETGTTRRYLLPNALAPIGPLIADPARRRIMINPKGSVILLDLENGALSKPAPNNFGVFSDDGRRFAIASMLTGLVVYDAETLKETSIQPALSGRIAFSPDGALLYTALTDLHAFDLSGVSPVRVISKNIGFARSIAVSPDGRRIVTGGRDRVIRVWDADNGEELLQLRGHIDGVTGLLFTPDGETLISYSGDYTIRIWNTHGVSDMYDARDAHRAFVTNRMPMLNPLIDKRLIAAAHAPESSGTTPNPDPIGMDLSSRERQWLRQAIFAELMRRASVTEPETVECRAADR